MDTTNTKTGNQSQKRNWLFLASVALIAISSAVVVSCFHDDDSAVTTGADTIIPTEPAPITVTGSSLFCDSSTVTAPSALAADTVALADADTDGIPKHNISFDLLSGDDTNPQSWNNHNSQNNLKRLGAVVAAQKPDGSEPTDPDTGLPLDIGDVHPLLVSYAEQVIGDFEGGDGSADIGDPDNVDDMFVSLSLDNGISWRKDKVGDTAKSSSKSVLWDSQNILYPGHSHKPTMAIQGNNILVAWNDKYCPSGNPFDLEDPATEDYYKVNGAQGVVDYGGIIAPNGKELFQVPYSCVWTARGVFSDTDLDGDGQIEIVWRQAQQLTTGTRDSNKIWIAPAEVGFAITWQEDPDGLRPGKGEGPGAGYSGATTNHGADIWYTYIRMEDFTDVCTEFDAEGVCTTSIDDEAAIATLGEKPKPAVNYTYPVRITNNDSCTPDDDTKLYCADYCTSTVSVTSNNQSGTSILRCVQNDLDYMTEDGIPVAAVLDGDTGASRPALKILKTNADEPEFVAILAYEETKGLSESDPADQGDSDADIALEGKAVYFESFFWDQPVKVSAGRIVNVRIPEAVVADDGSVSLTGDEIYENARRVVIMPQVDACEMQDGDPTFAIMYKQGYDTQGGPSDMFIRVNNGFIYDDFGQLDGRDVTNISSHANSNDPYDAAAGPGEVDWTTTNLEDQSYTYPLDNTFSPRGWLRGGEVYTGFEYSPLWRATSVGTVPNNFWMHSFVDSSWNGPKQLSIVTGEKVSTLDPRFVPTPKGSAALPSDASNPDVIFMSYGTFDMQTGEELDLIYMRSTDKGVNWEYIDSNGETVLVDSNPATSDGIPGTDDDNAARGAKLAAIADVHEMEVQGLASPDGTMFFNAWLEESAEPVSLDNAARYGLESRFGLVEYEELVVE